MIIAKFYDKTSKSGYITADKKSNFLVLLEKIENSDSAKCQKSHQKSIDRKVARNNSRKYSFEDFCEDHLDQHVALMSEKEKNDAFAHYNK